MDADLLRIVGQIAGIGGIALGVLLLVFRDIIRKRIFPQLARQQAYRLLRLMVVLVWSVAVLGIGAWVWTGSQAPAVTVDHGVGAGRDINVDGDIRIEGGRLP
jgi:multisubunit Na+/H+ antiporter MnhB subunit